MRCTVDSAAGADSTTVDWNSVCALPSNPKSAIEYPGGGDCISVLLKPISLMLLTAGIALAADAPVFPYGAVYFRKSNPPEQDWARDHQTAARIGMNTFRHWFMWS